MSDQSRLERAFAASAAPARDARFVLAVLERAERERFRRAALHSAVRGAVLTSGAAAALVMLTGWAAAQPAPVITEGVFSAVALLAAVGAARLFAARVGARTA
jgi:hypothetical protein